MFRGFACGAAGEAAGELCFNTSMSGYQEVLTDPSYAGQIVTMTMPHIGNYGVNGADMESRGVFAAGLRGARDVRRAVELALPRQSLPEFLARDGVVAIEGVDTRRLTRHLRERGAMRAVISTTDLDAGVARRQGRRRRPGSSAATSSPRSRSTEPYRVGRRDARPAASCRSTPACCRSRRATASWRSTPASSTTSCAGSSEAGCDVTVVPPTTTAAEVLALEPDGVFFANGPGDPAAVDYLYGTLRELLGVKPVFGICLGHQMLSLARGCADVQAQVRPPRRQPAGHEPAHRPRGDHEPEPRLLRRLRRASASSTSRASAAGSTLDAGDLGAWVRGGCGAGRALASASAACSSRTSTSTT